MKKNYLIEVNNLCKSYLIKNFSFPFFLYRKKFKKKEALVNVNIKIKFGEKVAFLGKNGSGKSTLLKIISRVTVPTKGEVLLRGKVISMLEAGLSFHPELTGIENIYMNAGLLGATKKEIKNVIPTINQFAELDEYIDLPVKKFSTGMEAKLGFSMGIFLNADLLILDELLSVVDGNFRIKCVQKINSLNTKLNKAIILVSHNMELVSKICDRGIVLDKGKIIYDNEISKAVRFYTKNILKKNER
jgi:lipopolysaccharide transport system ATP-binding protein